MEVHDEDVTSTVRRSRRTQRLGRRMCTIDRKNESDSPGAPLFNDNPGSVGAGGLVGGARDHARSDGGHRHLLEADLAHPGGQVRAGARECCAHSQCSGSQERRQRRGVDFRSSRTRPDTGELRAASPDSGCARSDADENAAGTRDRPTYSAYSENARERQHQADVGDLEHRRHQRAAHLESDDRGRDKPGQASRTRFDASEMSTRRTNRRARRARDGASSVPDRPSSRIGRGAGATHRSSSMRGSTSCSLRLATPSHA